MESRVFARLRTASQKWRVSPGELLVGVIVVGLIAAIVVPVLR
jgi:hypothetical protein